MMYKKMASRTGGLKTATPVASHILARTAMNPKPIENVPPIAQEVLRTSGHPLDAATRAYMEPRFGHDFSKVRVHNDGKAAESAREVNALAYTVGAHIAFENDYYRPDSLDGRKLIAHELTHVLQQSHGVGGNQASETHLEADAERAAVAITTEGVQPAPMTGWSAPALQRQKGGGQQTPPKPTAPSQRQKGIIDTARRAAAIRAQIAMFRVGGIVPSSPAGRPDAATESQMRARSLAQIRFHWENPNMEQIGEVISSMVTHLLSDTQVVIAPANDPDCGMRAAYVRGLRPPIVLCPTFFSDTLEQQIRTMLHESAHLARIGSADLGESYDVDYDCGNSFGEFDSADSWAHFVHCLSGQIPDKPTTIQGRVPAGSQGKPAQQQGSGTHP